MYKYIMAKQTDSPKHDSVKKNDSCFSPHNVIQQRAVHTCDSYAGRNTKLGYCSINKTGSVIQMNCLRCGKTREQCECGDGYVEDDSGDPTFRESKHEQYLNPSQLRANLRYVDADSGEAHHIIPGNVVKELVKNNVVSENDKDNFNGEWNGIMLHGSKDEHNNYVNQFRYSAPAILHRLNNRPNHNTYDAKVRNYLTSPKINDVGKVISFAATLKRRISCSRAEALDNMDIPSDPNL